MRAFRRHSIGALVSVAACWTLSIAGQAQVSRAPLPAEPLGATGESIYPVFEGWGPHKDGSTVLLLGYFNRNRSQTIDIPVGPNNRIEPGGPDYGQPTHFETGQQHGLFAIQVPKDFGTKRLTWTLTVNGQTTAVSFWLNPPYWLDFFKNAATGNEPPVIRFAADGPTTTGPPLGIAQSLSGMTGQPVTLRLWASDVPAARPGAGDELAEIRGRGNPLADPFAVIGDQTFGGLGRDTRARGPKPDITVSWKVHRGAGAVTIGQPRIPLVTKKDPKVFLQAATTATFKIPGEYVLRAQVNDESGDDGGGDQCCWTTAYVAVTVK